MRWIFEALVGGDLSGIDPEWFASKNSENPEEQLTAVKKGLALIVKNLQLKKHVLVGHNLFMDLAFIYNTFIGRLPAKVGHFQQMIHEHFPRVIDTKYLATHNADAMNPQANLKELLAPFKKIHIPLIVLHEQHTAYGAAYGKEHEAGFDSWMTAELFVKLSANIYATYLRNADDLSFFSAVTRPSHTDGSENTASSNDSDSGGGAPLKSRSASASPNKNRAPSNRPSGTPNNGSLYATPKKAQIQGNALGSGVTTNTNAHFIAATAATLAMTGQSAPTKPKRLTSATRIVDDNTPTTQITTSTSTMTPITVSRTPKSNHIEMDMAQDTLPPAYHAAQLNNNRYSIFLHDNDEEAAIAAAEPRVTQWIPAIGDKFWGVYLNKLRVNAVAGGVCDLAAGVVEDDDEETGEEESEDEEDSYGGERRCC